MEMVNVDVHGVCDEKFSRVREEFTRNFAERGDVGAAVAVTVEGETVVDLWGGYADRGCGRVWERDTLANVYSTTKGMTALCAHILVDRGVLDLDRPVVKYWPEFSQQGKEGIPVRWLLSHRAGLTGPAERLTDVEVRDWNRVVSALAATRPWWEPNTMSGYHAVTFGFLVGEVVRRVSGRSLGTFLHEEVALPLGADLFVGVPSSQLSRCADMIYGEDMLASAIGGSASHPGLTAIGNAPIGNVNKPEVRMAEIPAGNGQMTARGLATVYGALANGGEIGGIRVVSHEAIERMREPQPAMFDLMLSGVTGLREYCWGAGFMLNRAGGFGANPRAFGHGGAGGSLAFADPENRVSYAYVMNKMGGGTMGDDLRSASLVDALY